MARSNGEGPEFKQVKVAHNQARKISKVMEREARDGWEYVETVKQWTGIVLVFKRERI